MNTSAIEAPVEVLGSTLDEEVAELQDRIIPDKPAQGFGHRPREHDIVQDTAPQTTELERLVKKKQHWGFLKGKDAALYLRLSKAAPVEKPMDLPSLLYMLSSLLPRDRQLERRACKLAWQLSKGRIATCESDNVFLSELTPAESRLSDDDFLALCPDQVIPIKKGGRPRKYRTAKAQKRGHAERPQRYRDRKLTAVEDVTKTPLQVAET
jgi:hypothetical protein